MHYSSLPDISVFNAHIPDKKEWTRVTEENLHFALGNQYEYNQTNYWLLAQIIEKVLGISFEDYILNN
jgi:CubicO group peptidase (beta-lactamase class C family)